MFPVKEAILFLIAGVDIALAVAVIANNPKRVLNWSLSAIPLGAAVWAVGLAMLSLTSGSLVWGKVIFGSSFFVFPLLVIFSDAFPDKTKFERWYFLVLLSSLILFLALPSDLFLKSHIISGARIIKVAGPLYPVYNIFVLVCLGWTTFNLLSKYRGAVALVRLQLYYLLFGVFVFILFGLVTNLVLPLLGESESVMMGPAASLIFATCAAYTVIKYRLMDIRDVIQKGFVAIILVAAAPSLLFAIYQIIARAVPFGSSAVLSFAACLTLLVVVLAWFGLGPSFQRYTEKILFRGSYVYADTVAKLTKVLAEARSVEELCDALAGILTAALKVSRIVFFTKQAEGEEEFLPIHIRGVHDPQGFAPSSVDRLINYARQAGSIFIAGELERSKLATEEVLSTLRQNKFELCIPIKGREGLVGLVCLGEKLSGLPYTTRDVALLQVVSDLIGLALENASFYASMKEIEEGLKRYDER